MWQIEHQCPQCGAPVTMEETERLFACPYCRVKLYISSGSTLRYYLPPVCLEDRLAYVPYWRTKGIDFTCRASGVTTGVIDRTSLAHRSSCFPYSLGIRPQVFKLRFVGPTVEKALLQPSVDPHDVQTEVPEPVALPDCSPIPDPILFRVALREVESLIFSPVSMQGDALCDAIDGKNLGIAMDDTIPGTPSLNEAQHRVSFIPALCPNCGADLIAEKESVILFCSNCERAWKVADGALQTAGAAFLQGPHDATYLPFWRVQAEFQATQAMEDIQDTNHQLFIDPAKAGRFDARRVYLDDPTFTFWLPAFKVNASIFLMLAERASLAQAAINDAITETGGRLYPVTLPAGEAAKLLKVVVALLIDKRQMTNPIFAQMSAKPTGEPQLFFIPFSFSGYELIQEKMRVSVHPNALKYGKNL